MNRFNIDDQFAQLIAHVADLEEDVVLAHVANLLAGGEDPLAIIEACQQGLKLVGERYETREYYLSGLIMGGEIFRGVMEIVQPVIAETVTGSNSGMILIGTVRGDIHDIGKNNLIMLLKCYGFSVHDLGVDVPPKDFLLAAIQLKPDIIGLSGLLTSSYDAMKETIQIIRLSRRPGIAAIPIIIGGNQLNDQVCNYVAADYWVKDAMPGVRLCQKIMRGFP